jgi:hypothetical protein
LAGKGRQRKAGSIVGIRRRVGQNGDVVTVSAEIITTIGTVGATFIALLTYFHMSSTRMEARLNDRFLRIEKELRDTRDSLHREIVEGDTGTRGEIAGLAASLRAEIAVLGSALRAEMASGDAALRSESNLRFDAVTTRFDRLDGRLDGIDGRLDKLDDGLEGVRREVTEVKISVARLEGPRPRLIEAR